jgi:hypothetical protein
MFYFKTILLFSIFSASAVFCASDETITIASCERQAILDQFPQTCETVRCRLNSEEWHLNPNFLSACMILHVTRDGREKMIRLSPLDLVPDVETTHEHWLETVLTYAKSK